MTWVIEEPDMAREFAARVVGGLLKTAKYFSPTYENDNGKKVHSTVPVVNGVLHVNGQHAPGVSLAAIKASDFCLRHAKKKKDPLREAMEEWDAHLNASLNYGGDWPWLSTHGKNIRQARLGPEGIWLAVSPGVVELNLRLTAAGAEYAGEVRRRIEDRVREENLIAGPFEVPPARPASDTAALVIGAAGASFAPSLVVGLPETQIMLKPAMLPKGPAEASAYSDPLGGRIVRIAHATKGYTAEQFFRVLEV